MDFKVIVFFGVASMTVGLFMIYAKLCEIERHMFFTATHLRCWLDENIKEDK